MPTSTDLSTIKSNSLLKTKSKGFGAIKNTITGKTIRKMNWQEILNLPAEKLYREGALRRIKQAHAQKAGE